MGVTRRCLIGVVVAVAAAAMGISGAPPAGADPSNCQQVGATTVCGQGTVNGGGQSAAPAAPAVPPKGGGGCNAYGTYQNCIVGGNTGRP